MESTALQRRRLRGQHLKARNEKAATVDIEHRKLELEQEKLGVERSKARWTAVSIVVTALAAGATILGTAHIQDKQAQARFQLKAAELVLAAQSANQARASAEALATMFPEQLPRDFAARFPADLPAFGPDITQAKIDMLKLMAARSPKSSEPLIKLWCQFFPEDVTFKCAR